MFDTSPEGISTLIKQGESINVEFKTKLPAADIIANVIASFANTDGGILLVGIEDDGNIKGLTIDELTPAIEKIDRVAKSLLPQPVEMGTQEIHGKIVLYVIVDRASEHQSPIMSSNGSIFQRRGDKTISIPGSSLKGILRSIAEEKQSGRYDNSKKNLNLFVAMSFRNEEEPALVDYYRAMERAVEISEIPIEIRRMDLVEGDYEISQQIMDEIDNADIVLADFTLNSRNVYFELGYARAKGCYIIQTARKGTNLEFDIRNWRTLFYRNATELEERLINELKMSHEKISNNVS